MYGNQHFTSCVPGLSVWLVIPRFSLFKSIDTTSLKDLDIYFRIPSLIVLPWTQREGVHIPAVFMLVITVVRALFLFNLPALRFAFCRGVCGCTGGPSGMCMTSTNRGQLTHFMPRPPPAAFFFFFFFCVFETSIDQRYTDRLIDG